MNGNLFGVSDADPNKNIQNPPNMWRSSTTETDFFYVFWSYLNSSWQHFPNIGGHHIMSAASRPKVSSGTSTFFPNWQLGPRKDQLPLKDMNTRNVSRQFPGGFSEASFLLLPSTQITRTSNEHSEWRKERPESQVQAQVFVWFWPFGTLLIDYNTPPKT